MPLTAGLDWTGLGCSALEMEERKSVQTNNKLKHLFESLLHQQQQHLPRPEQRTMQEPSSRIPRAPIEGNLIRTGRTKLLDRESTRFGFQEPRSVGSDDSRRAKSAAQCEWSAEAVSCLLKCYGGKYVSGRGYLRNSDWEEVVSTVNAVEGLKDLKTMKHCRDKVDSLRKRYKLEKMKAIDSGSSAVSWPLFSKLDEMMSCQPRVARIPGGVDAGVKLPFPEPSHLDPLGERPKKLDSPEGCAADVNGQDFPCPNLISKGKISPEEIDGLSEEDFNRSPRRRQDNPWSRTGTQESLDKGSRSRKGLEQPGVSGKACSKKRKAKVVDPIQALADAVVGFSDVFARIEMAKMEIFTKMKLEMAKLERKSRKRSSSSSSSSESE